MKGTGNQERRYFDVTGVEHDMIKMIRLSDLIVRSKSLCLFVRQWRGLATLVPRKKERRIRASCDVSETVARSLFDTVVGRHAGANVGAEAEPVHGAIDTPSWFRPTIMLGPAGILLFAINATGSNNSSSSSSNRVPNIPHISAFLTRETRDAIQ
ncbi:hypothetical protein C4D60_Mb04t20310 [Musa balbisiana]|uniref:Uncharacterized protein n=1 Tax=Musa balbisiana TaxID=52838 RepID=A0A4S8KDG4_MUSBA|nr:hypothetical protein C4D60_Mb04t20310 [Musa balbisiana]